MKLAGRMGRLGTETAFSVLAKAKALEAQGRDIIHLEIGEPDFDTAGHIVEAGCRALRSGETHYTPTAGIPELREAIAADVARSRGISVDPAQVVVTPGGKPIMFFAILALVERGDEVLMPNPAFPIYESMVDFVGGTPVFVPLRQENGFRFDLDEFGAGLSGKTRLVILNSPANPTGGVFTAEDIAGIAEILREYPEVTVLSDEIYARLLYSGSFASIASEPGFGPDQRTIVLDGFSKTYAMTGWRLGYGVMPEPLAEQVTKLQVNSNSCTAAATQHAGLAALHGPQDGVDRMLEEFRGRRDLIVAGLNDLPGVECISPQGAFYAFPKISATGHPAADLADLLLNEAGVACLSGTAFGRHGEGHLRLSYANSRENISRALDRMNEVLARTAR
ncbi:aminotransferase class I/II-fold pyridoxal phosphate-dependent enzyme [Rubrobacter tropicus]|uniref:Aminotransferase n=1 Tax=Rubrobacter tropicus TaxID=2653851 RepID=A0A6G8Q653_9ACTN|nr:pyridoxal phosphate-dependent aminotransferase [Rubrobacter tropicus]QIN81908.1 aminotransferase class I/II-fold pyridoxal phosphate-dependent enzyme [Rubrobacter tropicus]